MASLPHHQGALGRDSYLMTRVMSPSDTSGVVKVADQTKENAAASPGRDLRQGPSEPAPPGWVEVQNSLAAAADLAIVLTEGEQSPTLATSNDNSICRAFQSSPEYRERCAPYCGRAHERALNAGGIMSYQCHAGLHCFALPVDLAPGRKLAVIGGRAFLTSADYRALAERFRAGDLQELLSSELFKNVIFASSSDLTTLAERLESAVAEFASGQSKGVGTGPTAASQRRGSSPSPPVLGQGPGKLDPKPAHPFRPGPSFAEACRTAIRPLAEKHSLDSLVLFLRERNTFEPAFAVGRFAGLRTRLEIGPKDSRLSVTAKAGTSLAMAESEGVFRPAAPLTAEPPRDQIPLAELFPLVVGDEVKGGLLIADTVFDDEKRGVIGRFCREAALPLEVLRLRSELEQRARVADYLQSFTERLNAVDPAETYLSILRQSAELLSAERGSLLLFDEDSNELAMKASIGMRADVAGDLRISLGESVSGTVMLEGRPLVVRDVELAGRTPAPAERRYKTKSFISYPIAVGGRRVGVLNVTDKTGGGAYDESDLVLLETLAPQMALALDRAEWRQKAARFQLMSITDPLTGLLNRRYLEERLMEELNRSKRHNFDMSFMMIDIDDFKLYNDRNGHQAGDVALEMTALCMKSALRAADVASRYGGEEFCILLPQTTLAEAKIIAERIKRRVERTRYPHGKEQPLGAVTVSIGLSAFSSGLESPAAVIGAADRALYLAKHQGKNRVEQFAPPPTGAATPHAAREPKKK